MIDWFERHHARLEKAIEACRTREAWSPFHESPSRKLHGEDAPRRGETAFRARLNERFELDQPGTVGWIGKEVSPYTGQPLGVTYPQPDLEALFEATRISWPEWAEASVETRIGVCMEMIERLYQHSFEIANAAMHTTGQAFSMAFAGSGPNALDRGIEAVAYAYQSMSSVPHSGEWERAFGSDTIHLHKTYHLIPLGVAVVIACATFPTWNGYPAIFANLATGNPVIVKPHPNTILPLAISVEIMRETLREAGFDPNLVLLAADTLEAPIAKQLVTHPDTAIIDFTGSCHFGEWIQDNARRKLIFTETSGVNSVVIHSTDDLQAMTNAVGTALCMFSAQMCTSPQNVYIPRGGITVNGEPVSFDQVVKGILDAIDHLSHDAKVASGVFGAIQSANTLNLLEQAAQEGQTHGTILRQSGAYTHTDYAEARTATPLIIQLDGTQADMARREWFGPIAFIIAAESADQALAQATADAKAHGAITAHVYSTDEHFLAKAEKAYAWSGANLTCNLRGNMPLNFAAAYSDYHVTGLNPAGSATLTDAAFIAGRYRVAQTRVSV